MGVTGSLVTIDLAKLNIQLSASPKVWTIAIADTGSMDGFMDYGNSALLIAGSNPDDHTKLIQHLIVGDIIVFGTGPGKAVMHRIVEIKDTPKGKRYITRGDNNAYTDSYEVYAGNLQWVCVGVLY